MQYTLYRVKDDSSTTFISEHGDVVEGMQAGKYMVEEVDHDYPYALHSNGTRLSTFGKGRIGLREWMRRTGRLDTIHAQDDRYDHDIDELMV